MCKHQSRYLPTLGAQCKRKGKKMPISRGILVFPRKWFDFILYEPLPEGLTSNQHDPGSWLLFHGARGLSGHFHCLLPTRKPGHQHLQKKLAQAWCPSTCVYHQENRPLDSLALVGAGIHESHRIATNQHAVLGSPVGMPVLTKAIPPGLSTKEAAKMSNSQSFIARALIEIFTSYNLRVQLLISTHFGANYDPLWSPKEPVHTFPAFSFLLTSTRKASHRYLPIRSWYTFLEPQFLQLAVQGLALKLPCSDSQQALHS